MILLLMTEKAEIPDSKTISWEIFRMSREQLAAKDNNYVGWK